MHWPDKEVQQRYKERAKIALKRAQEWREKEEQRKRETEALKHIYGLHGAHVMLWYARTYERSNGRSWGNLSEIMPGMVEARHKAGLPPWFSKSQLSDLYTQAKHAEWLWKHHNGKPQQQATATAAYATPEQVQEAQEAIQRLSQPITPVEEALAYRKYLDTYMAKAAHKRAQRQANWIQGAIVVALCIFFITQCTN